MTGRHIDAIDVNPLNGAVLVKRGAFEAIGGFDEWMKTECDDWDPCGETYQKAGKYKKQKNDIIDIFDTIIMDKDAQIDDLSLRIKCLAEENSRLAKEKLRLKKIEQQLYAANLKIAQHENHLNLMYTSLSWRVTWPLRWLGSLVLKTIMRPSLELSPKRISKVTDNRSYSLPAKSGVDIDKEAIGTVIHKITGELKAKMPE